MEWRKGFLSSSEDDVAARRSTAQKKKVAEALPDEAFLPAETYELGDDDEGDAADPRVAVLETSDEAHEYSVDRCRAHCSAYNKGLIKLDPEVTLNFCNDARAVMFNRKIFGHHEGEGKGGRQRAMLLPSGIVMQYLEWGCETAPNPNPNPSPNPNPNPHPNPNPKPNQVARRRRRWCCCTTWPRARTSGTRWRGRSPSASACLRSTCAATARPRTRAAASTASNTW